MAGAPLAVTKPADIFDRAYEWDDLARFVTDSAPGLRIGVVRGRRRHGKSFVLEHLCRALNGAYLLALQESRTMALDRFSAAALGRRVGFPVGRFGDWVAAMDTVMDGLTRAASRCWSWTSSPTWRRARRSCRR